jgi:hypothetical protein
MTRRPRSLAAVLAAFALVFAQLAVSAHACELRGSPVRSEVTTHHEGCHEMAPADQAPATDNVCFEHCQYGDASVDNSPPTPAAVDSAGPVFRLAPVTQAPADLRPAWRLAPAAAPPPPAILFGVLRI